MASKVGGEDSPHVYFNIFQLYVSYLLLRLKASLKPDETYAMLLRTALLGLHVGLLICLAHGSPLFSCNLR